MSAMRTASEAGNPLQAAAAAIWSVVHSVLRFVLQFWIVPAPLAAPALEPKPSQISTPELGKELRRRPPRQQLPRASSTRQAPVLGAPHSHRRCTSSSNTTQASTVPPARPPRNATDARETLAVALRCAIVRKEARSVKTLLANKAESVSSILTQWSDPFGSSLIHSAAGTGEPAVLEELLGHVLPEELVAVVNRPGLQGQTALHIACTKHAHALSKILLEHGADANASTRLGTRPLHLASATGDLELCRLLLEHQADPNCVSEVSAIPLLTAVHLRKPELVRLLLFHGADPALTTSDGVSARELATRLDDKELISILGSPNDNSGRSS